MIDLGDKFWPVSNYDDIYLGSIDVEQATIESDNTVYAQLTQLVGSKKVAETAKQLGIRSKLNGVYSIGLGAEEVNPLELARAYATFANGGRRVDGAMVGDLPRVFTKVNENGRRTLFNAGVPRRVMSPTQTAILNSILGEGRQPGHRTTGAAPRPAGGGQDRNDGGLRRRVVRRLHAAARRGDLGRLSGEPEADADGVPRRGRGGRHLPRADLEELRRAGLARKKAQYFPNPLFPYAAPKTVTRRGDRVLLDNGLCRSTHQVVYFNGFGPTQAANCLENEVQVPDVRRLTLAEAEARVQAQPLTAKLVYKPAAALRRPGIVVDQQPRKGYRSSYDSIILVVSKATHGVIPNLVGTTLDKSLLELRKLKLQPHITLRDGKPGTVLKQKPAPGLAAAPGLKIELVVARDAARTAAAGG